MIVQDFAIIISTFDIVKDKTLKTQNHKQSNNKMEIRIRMNISPLKNSFDFGDLLL